jgi:HD superfamily phosphohydrolase YqeK
LNSLRRPLEYRSGNILYMSDAFLETKTWFDGYVEKYLTDDPVDNQVIRLKQDHTHRVCHNAAVLGDALGLSPHDKAIARLTGLLHDVGRFKQFTLYRTFNDAVSENHARLGLREIGLHQVLGRWRKEDRRLICRAIAYHNAIKLPENADERSLLFMKLIRDADKLDVYRVLIQNYREQDQGSSTTVLHRLPDTPACSPIILEALLKKKAAKFEDMKSLNDFKLLQLGWVYDLNFTPTFQAFHRLKYIEQISELLPRTEPVVAAVDQALEYVASRI